MPDRFLIAYVGRSGSSYLQGALDSHPQCTCLGEILWQHQDLEDVEAYVERSLDVADKTDVALGFKFGNTHIIKYPNLRPYLLAQKFRVIHLTRLNRIEQYVYMRLAFENNSWRSDDGPWHIHTLTIELDHMDEFLNRFELHDRIIKKYFESFDTLNVTFEGLLQGGMPRVLEFLDLPYAELVSPFKRQGGSPLRDVVRNYDELIRHLRGTPYEPFVGADL